MLFFKILNENKQSFIYVLILLISTIAFSSSLIILCYKYESLISSFTLTQWAVVFVCLSLAMSLSLTSTTLAAVLIGYFLGWPALPFYILIYLIATIIGNLIASGLDRGRFINTLKKMGSIDHYLTAIEKEQLPLIILARLSPIFPFSIMNVFLAAAEFKLNKILIGSFVGMIPRTVIAFWIGTQFHQLRKLLDEGLENNLFEVSLVALIIVSLAGFYFYFSKIVKRAAKKYV